MDPAEARRAEPGPAARATAAQGSVVPGLRHDTDERQRLVRRGAGLVLVAGRHVGVRPGRPRAPVPRRGGRAVVVRLYRAGGRGLLSLVPPWPWPLGRALLGAPRPGPSLKSGREGN